MHASSLDSEVLQHKVLTSVRLPNSTNNVVVNMCGQQQQQKLRGPDLLNIADRESRAGFVFLGFCAV